MPIVEPEILLDGEHGIERTFEVAQKVWAETFFYMAENSVMFEGILLKPSMVTPGAECEEKATPEQVAEYTLRLLRTRIPPAVPGIMVSALSSCYRLRTAGGARHHGCVFVSSPVIILCVHAVPVRRAV